MIKNFAYTRVKALSLVLGLSFYGPSVQADTCVNTIAMLLNLYGEANVQSQATGTCDSLAVFNAVNAFYKVIVTNNNDKTYVIDPTNPNSQSMEFSVSSQSSPSSSVKIIAQRPILIGIAIRKWDPTSKTLTLSVAQVPKDMKWIPISVLKQINVPPLNAEKGFPTIAMLNLLAINQAGVNYGDPQQFIINDLSNMAMQRDVVSLYKVWRTQNQSAALDLPTITSFLLKAESFVYIKTMADLVGKKVDSVVGFTSGIRNPVPFTIDDVSKQLDNGFFGGINITLKLVNK